MPILYQSPESGVLYAAQDVDPEDQRHWMALEVPETVTVTAADLCGNYGSISEMLLRTEKARKIHDAR